MCIISVFISAARHAGRDTVGYRGRMRFPSISRYRLNTIGLFVNIIFVFYIVAIVFYDE